MAETSHPTVRDRLRAARDRSFRGRERELERLARLLDPDTEQRVAFVHGPGGVGKSTLLRAFETASIERGMRCLRVDCRDFDPRPELLNRRLARALGADHEDALAEVLGKQPTLVILDTFETFGAFEDWLRREWIPELPDSTRLCVAGRNPPSTEWTTELGWASLLDAFALHNFTPEESRAFLTGRGVPVEDIPAIQELTCNHPLALALASELTMRAPEPRFGPEVGRDVLQALLGRFQSDVPDHAHRLALEASAVVRTTTESILRRLLEVDDAGDLFEWLASLSFMEAGPHGLFPHDLVRNCLIADLSRRDPDRRRELHRRARKYYVKHIIDCWDHPVGMKPLELFYSLAFLHRNNPVAGLFDFHHQEIYSPGTVRPAEWPRIEAAVRQLEGEAGVRCVRGWAERQPEACIVVRDRRDEAVGFALLPILSPASADEASSDPAAAAAWRFLESASPLRGEESAVLTRIWVSLDGLQGVTAESAFLFLHTVGIYLSRPNLAYAIALFHDIEFWLPAFRYMSYERIEGADFEISGRRVSAVGIDWRRTPPRTWLELLFDRELDPNASFAPGEDDVSVLARGDFDTALRDALKAWSRPGGLLGNPLTRSRLVRRNGNGGEAVPEEALRGAIRGAWEALGYDPAYERAQTAVRHTYIDPIGTQERVAERMHVSFSTYRRHLQRGVQSISDALWEREIAGVPTPERS